MLRFEYRAIAPDGSFLNGEVYSEDSESANQELQSRGLNVQTIGPGTIPIWIQTIEKCLTQREEMIGCLESCRSQSAWLNSDGQLATLIRRLRGGAGASEFVAERELAMFLPLILLFAPNRNAASEFNDWIQSYLSQSNQRRLIWKLEAGGEPWSSLANQHLVTYSQSRSLFAMRENELRIWTLLRLAGCKRVAERRRAYTLVSLVQPISILLIAVFVLWTCFMCFGPLVSLVTSLSG